MSAQDVVSERGGLTADLSMNVLLVDDYRSMTRILRRLMENLGFSNIDEAADGAAALRLIGDRAYGVILSDWQMAPMDGMQLLKAIRAGGRNKATPFVMVTSKSKVEDIKAARAAGASNYIVKPFDEASLKRKLVAVLGDW
jgi:two-component system chemotaxis response regulator CheY